ncbi:trypsin-like peptidase domain-containing protein [Variovorax sp. OAS795]|uniref:trypsin-like peptidase domain-containing protein n=1 Tax=Variovorax sp. OAS795 TaxID=3034231 RepID=UPI003397EB86
MNTYIHPITQLVHSTVRIVCSNAANEMSFGSGYICAFNRKDDAGIPCIVTNKHVVRGAVTGVFHLTRRNANGTPDLENHEAVTVRNIGQYCIPHPDPRIDLVAVPIGAILNSAQKDDKNYHIVQISMETLATPELLDSLPHMEEIVMIGYPNGLWDERHNLPIIRKGITATHPKLRLNGKPEFLIDAACFPGSSGSPVFLANIGSYVDSNGALCAGSRVALLGTLYAGPQHTTKGEIVVVDVPTDTKSIAVGTIPNNLGYVIQASELRTLEEEVIRTLVTSRVARNSPCPCQSGKRFKECCGVLS